MDERWDNDLNKRIKEVFDNYEDTSADEGWQLLREKYPEKKKRRVAGWMWLSGAAALLLLFVGILRLRSGNENNGQQLVNGKKTPNHDTISQLAAASSTGRKADSISVNKQNPTSVSSAAPKNTLAQSSVTGKADSYSAKRQNQTSLSSAASGNNLAQNEANKTESMSNSKKKTTIAPGKPGKEIKQAIRSGAGQPVAVANNNGATPPASNSITRSNVKQPVTNQPGTANTSEQAIASNSIVLANSQPKNDQPSKMSSSKARIDSGAKSYTANSQPGINMKQQQPKKPTNIFEDNQVVSNQKERDKKLPMDSKLVKFGIYAATYVNYAKGSNNQFNVGAGVTSDIRVTDNLKISTGVLVGQNSLTYASQLPPPTSSSTSLVAASNYATMTKLSLYTVSAPQFRSYDASLIGLDIPLNLKYVFKPGKRETYILAGVSSGTFINEKYTYSYSNPALFTSGVSQVQGQSASSNFSSFYFAKTLNFAFGTGYTFGTNRVIIEPFLKYPLDGLGSQQLKFGAGGVNLKFDFKVRKR
jgi:hypothetical protein